MPRRKKPVCKCGQWRDSEGNCPDCDRKKYRCQTPMRHLGYVPKRMYHPEKVVPMKAQPDKE